jgi:fructose-1,6-bisphosphatase/inositol monophosphatase family enzyme
MSFHLEREFAVAVLRKGAVLLSPFMADEGKRRDSRRHKAVGEVVTEADQRVNAFVLSELAERFPQDSVCAEEGSDRDDPDARRRWILDPIDGTRSFIEGKPGYSMMLALAVEGEPVVGVVHDPVSGVTWHATRGEGVWRDDHTGRDRVLPGSHEPRLIWSPYAGLEAGLALAEELGLAGMLERESFGLRAMDVLHDGGGAFASRPGSPHIWDTAPGWLIMRESGGTVTGYDGRPLSFHHGPTLHPHGAVASLNLNHTQVCKLVSKHLPPI